MYKVEVTLKEQKYPDMKGSNEKHVDTWNHVDHVNLYNDVLVLTWDDPERKNALIPDKGDVVGYNMDVVHSFSKTKMETQ